MPKVNAKRQITLPADQCRLAGIDPCDEYLSFVTDGRITIVRLEPGSSWGCMAHLEGDRTVSEEESRRDVMEGKRGQTT
ncbi:MAG: AbrB/MazE/SpoVT family DNA-binding domain-containing protein [Gemmatimonadetes bacterium]|nr:AbrB/MazE/SpoVT family DNA-binding domain-containing protein [Gemmatimonadota bacterium]